MRVCGRWTCRGRAWRTIGRFWRCPDRSLCRVGLGYRQCFESCKILHFASYQAVVVAGGSSGCESASRGLSILGAFNHWFDCFKGNVTLGKRYLNLSQS